MRAVAEGAEVAAKEGPDAPPDLDYSFTAAAKNGGGGTIGLEPTRPLSFLCLLPSRTPPQVVFARCCWAEAASQMCITYKCVTCKALVKRHQFGDVSLKCFIQLDVFHQQLLLSSIALRVL